MTGTVFSFGCLTFLFDNPMLSLLPCFLFCKHRIALIINPGCSKSNNLQSAFWSSATVVWLKQVVIPVAASFFFLPSFFRNVKYLHCTRGSGIEEESRRICVTLKTWECLKSLGIGNINHRSVTGVLWGYAGITFIVATVHWTEYFSSWQHFLTNVWLCLAARSFRLTIVWMSHQLKSWAPFLPPH